MKQWTEADRAAASERAQRRRSAKGNGSVFKVTVHGERVWRATLSITTDEGKRKIITGTSGDKRTAIERRDRRHREWLVQQGQADPRVLIDEDTRVWTVEDWLNKWAEEQPKDEVQGNTRQRNRGLIKNHINPHLGKRKLLSVTETHIQELLKETLPAKKNEDGSQKLGSSPLRAIYYILKDAFTQAERERIITKNPMRFVDAPKKGRKTPLALGERMDDIPKLLAYLKDRPEDHVYWALAFYGLRASERLGLEWSSFENLHENARKPARLKIDRQLYNDAESRKLSIKYETKTDAGTRVVPLPVGVRRLLLNHRDRWNEMSKSEKWRPAKGFEDLVFTTATGNPIRQAKDNARWTKLLQDAGIAPMRGHDMRHLTASYLAKVGVPAEVVKSILGHNSVAMTSYYTHISNEQKHEAVLALAEGYRTAPLSDAMWAGGVVDLMKPAVEGKKFKPKKP